MPKRKEHKIINAVEHKHCYKCKMWIPLYLFNKNKSIWDGLDNKCRSCQHQYYLDNKERISARGKNYYGNNSERIKKQSSEYRQHNPGNYKQYYRDNSKKISAQRKEYRRSFSLYQTYAPQLQKYEEVRRCTNNNELLEVKCAYCGAWFLPTNMQIVDRIGAINGKIPGELRFYCSENCKMVCPTYNRSKYPKGFKKATSREVVPLLRQLVLKRDNYACQRCGATTEEAQLHVHHEKSYTLNKIMANDPDNCWTLCKKCHKKVHSEYGCRYSDLKCPK